MSAFVISNINVKNAEKLKDYAGKAGPTIAAHGGRVVLRGGFVKTLAGDADPHSTGILEFPDLSSVEAWYASGDYQALIPLREEACDMTLTVYQVPA